MKGEKAGAGFRIGPGMASLLMILVTLLMAALAILAMAGAQTDATLSQRNLDATVGYYQAAAQMQRELAGIDGRLLEARKAAAGDAGAYERLVRAIQADHPAEPAEDAGGLILWVAVPMRNDFYLEALLRVPLQLAGPRFEMFSHKPVDRAPWEAQTHLNLFSQ
ncbi:MAG: hypothetical protein FWE77_03140 [Clostridia bacterium]|nr:hypothetical protein [Clostridia bacterium]